MIPVPLRIATLDCDTPVPNVYAERGLYSDIFEALLRDAAANTENIPELELHFSKYDCVVGNLPSYDDLRQVNAIIITGSSASVYGDAPWIKSVLNFIKDIYACHPNIKIFGSCFGHQLICDAIFSTPTRRIVSRDPAGWELGVHPITLSSSFLSHFGPVKSNPTSSSQLRLQFVHADHAVLPIMPHGFESIGRSEHCALQGVWKRGHVLTYQGHAEFDRFVNGETITVFGKPTWDASCIETALRLVDRDDDATWAAGVMLRFFLEDTDSNEGVLELCADREEVLMAKL